MISSMAHTKGRTAVGVQLGEQQISIQISVSLACEVQTVHPACLEWASIRIHWVTLVTEWSQDEGLATVLRQRGHRATPMWRMRLSRGLLHGGGLVNIQQELVWCGIKILQRLIGCTSDRSAPSFLRPDTGIGWLAGWMDGSVMTSVIAGKQWNDLGCFQATGDPPLASFVRQRLLQVFAGSERVVAQKIVLAFLAL